MPGLAHAVRAALVLLHENGVIALSAETEASNGERGIKRQAGVGFGSRLLHPAEIGKAPAKTKCITGKLGLSPMARRNLVTASSFASRRSSAALEKFIQIHARGSRGESRSASFSSRSVSSEWPSNILAKPISARD
jgi:hypothetical protein